MKLVAIFSNDKKVRREQKRESNAATTQQLNATEVTAFLREKHQPHAGFKHPNGKEELVIWGADGDDAEEASEDESEQYEIDGLDSDVESEDEDDDGGALRPAYAARPVLQCPTQVPKDLQQGQEIVAYFGPPCSAWFEGEIVQVNMRKYRSENVHAMFYFVDAQGARTGEKDTGDILCLKENYGANGAWALLQPVDDGDSDGVDITEHSD